MNIRSNLTLASLLLLAACTAVDNDPIDYVDPFIGTGYHGHTYPGATTPFGMVQLSPDTRADNWDACSGYHYSDNTIDGFSHTHLSGTGCADLADIMFYPSTRTDLVVDGKFNERPYSFSHADEIASCGYYSVILPEDGLEVELTASPRVGVHRYNYVDGDERHIVIDLMHTVTPEQIDMHSLEIVRDNEIVGMRRTHGWVPNHYVYFAARFSEPFEDVEILDNKQAVITFSSDVETVTAAVGLSAVSWDNARENMLTEVPTLDFDIVHSQAITLWRDALSDIEVTGGDKEELTNFYTAQYHTKLTPNLMSDVNGEYRRHDMSIGTMPQGENYYSTLSLWDTFRAWNPLQTLVNTELVSDMVVSMMDMYDASGELPLWPLASGETFTMIGYHSASVIADAYVNGVGGFNPEQALAAMVHSSNINKKGSDYYTKLGYIPADLKQESVSCALEYAYDDWAIAQMAKKLGNEAIYEQYSKRAQNYINIFNGESSFFRGRNMDGSWTTPFEPYSTGRDYTEATPWHYRWFVPHDIYGLEQLFGSRESFIAELDRLFSEESAEQQIDVSDVTGLMGQYAHGNEPSHHMAYLYSYVGQPWKTQHLTRQLLREMYAATPEGIIGNEDCGQMSAWYILSSLGFYPVCPGSSEFVVTTPQFPLAKVELANGNTLTIRANNPGDNTYIKSLTLNGETIEQNFLTYDQIMQGGELVFELSAEPNLERGVAPTAAPYSQSEEPIASIPYSIGGAGLFAESASVDMATTTPGAIIRYTTDGSEPTASSKEYSAPVVVNKTTTIKAKAFKDGYAPSATMSAVATKAKFLAASSRKPSQAGVKYTYYEGKLSSVNQIKSSKRVSSGVMPTPSIKDAPKEDHFSYIFEGQIYIPESGIWEFMTKSDDGSVLYIGGELVVNNDGSHAAIQASGRVALTKGYHKYELQYFEDYEGHDLQWGWRAPGADEFSAIPEQNLYQ